MPLRFNHMELTVPVGTLKKERENLAGFYGEIFGFTCIEVPMVELDVNDKFLMSSDTEFSQFFFLAEDPKHLEPQSYDHIGFLMDNWDDVDNTLVKVKEWQKKDPRVQLMHLDSDFEAGPVFTHFYYFRYLLPIWIDVQYLKWKDGMKPLKQWKYG
jgi:hypothetical protein